MGFKIRQPDEKLPHIVGERQSAFGYIRRQVWTNPVLLDADGLLDGESVNGAAHTVTSFLNTLDFPRKLTLVASGATTDDCVITGTNIRDEVITETIALNGTNTVTTTKAFKTVTSIALPQVAGETVDFGWSSALGLDRCMAANEVVLATVAGAYETTRPTVSYDADEVEKNTVLMNTALDGAKDLTLVYVSVEKTGKRNTTS